ncbi:uncharacterized protein LOC105905163 isoform X3 [Clupea harengus]|uniref:Uncharacterized protein LOC105905163 isoform X3 n=1 Tax=Clupea harengus TaxID=7950 RepID=A0A6P3W3M1_CLUHA|nr:uncharacterized protein LOC105905163 isoform X3 [Clupea harengus]
MTKLRYLSVLLSQRLTLAAQEIFKDVEETILELQEETKLAKQENAKLKLKLREAGINSCDESREAVTPAECPAEVQSCGEQRPEVLLEDSSTIASLKQELDALDELETGSVEGGPAAMQIKMEMNYTECSSLERQSGFCPQSNSSGMQTDSVTVSMGEVVASWPVLEPHESQVFPCVERTWSVAAKGAETSQITERPCSRTGNCPPEDDDQDNVDEEVTHDPVKESENIDEEIHHKPQMPQEKPCTRAELARCSNSCLENRNEESTVGKETSSNNIKTVVRTGKPRGRPRKHPQTSTPKPALIDLKHDTRNSRLRSGNERTSAITGRMLRRLTKHPQLFTNKSVEVDNGNGRDLSRIGRPIGRPKRHLQIAKAKPDAVNLQHKENSSGEQSSSTIRSSRLSGKHRKHSQTLISKSDEVNSEQPSPSDDETNSAVRAGSPKGRSRSHPRNSRAKSDEVNSEHEESCSIEKPTPVRTGRPRGRPRKHPQTSTANSDEVNLEDEENIYGEASHRPCKHTGTSTAKSEKLQSEENASGEGSSSAVRTGRSRGRPRKHLQASTSKPDEVNLEDEENTLVEESNPMVSTGRLSGRPRKHPQSTTIEPAEVDLDHKDSVSEDPSISEDNTDLSRSNRTSGRLRTRTETSTVQPVEMDHQDSASSDDEGDDGDSSMFEKPRSTPMKRPRSSSSSDFEIDTEQEDEPSDEDSSCGSHNSTRNERSRKNLRTSRAKAVESDLDHVSVLTHDMGLVKKGYCLYCAKPIVKLARHLAMRHFDQKDVVKALSLPKNSKERKIQIGRLRNCGNRAHNNRVLKEGRGLLIPCRAFKAEDPKDVVYCHGCHGMFSKESISKHFKLCAFVGKEDNADPCPEEDPSLHMVVKQAPKDFSEVLSGMYQDDVTEAVRQDKLLLKLGQIMFDKRLTCEYIWQRLRELGRLLLNGRKITPLHEMEDYIRLSNWDHLAAAVKDVAGFCETTCTFAIPKYAVAIRRSLPKIAGIVKCDAETSGDKEMVENAQNFQESLLIKWHQQFVAPGMPISNSPLLVVAEQTSNGREDQRSGSEDNISAAQSRTEHEMERLKHSAIQVLPANQADEAQIKNTLESSTGEERSGNRNSACPPEDDDLEREAGDDEDDNDTDCDDDDDDDYDANDDDDASGHDVDSDGDDDDFVPILRSANKTLNSKNESLNGPCDSAQNDTPPKPLNQLQPQRITAAAGNPKRKGVAKQKWNQAEIQAVETHMAMFISSGKTPGKKACTACIVAEPDALKARNWTAIKFYTKNRITSLRKQNSKPSQT